MNKKEFLSYLEKKLAILEENEIKDIISEYKDIIEQKVKDGKSEKEAVNEFGNIDELVEEILKAYKINPKYSSNNKDNWKETSEDFETWIKKAANTLADTAKEVYSNFKNKDMSIETVCELIIKFIIMLVILAVLRLPFIIIESLGVSVVDVAVFPLNNILVVIWKIFTGILYFGVCILIFVAMFKQYVNKDGKEVTVENVKETKKEKFNRVNENKKEHIKEDEPTNNDSRINSKINSVLSIIYKLFMIMTFILPLGCCLCAVAIALSVSLYYAIIGINIWGLVIILFGVSIGLGWAIDIFSQLTFKLRKIHFYQIFISLFVIMIGSLLFTNNIFSFEYVDEKPYNEFNYKTESKEFSVTANAKIKVNEYVNKEYEIDDTLEDNRVIVEFTYNSDLTELERFDLEYNLILNGDARYELKYKLDDDTTFNSVKDVYHIIIDDLKDGKFYNYDKLDDPTIKIIANTKTMDIIK